VYEKQDDSSSEPHLSSSGTRTYVVSEPDPSNTPYQVPSGAYPTSAPFDFGSTTEPGVRNTEVPGEIGHRGGSHSGVGLTDAVNTKRGRL